MAETSELPIDYIEQLITPKVNVAALMSTGGNAQNRLPPRRRGSLDSKSIKSDTSSTTLYRYGYDTSAAPSLLRDRSMPNTTVPPLGGSGPDSLATSSMYSLNQSLASLEAENEGFNLDAGASIGELPSLKERPLSSTTKPLGKLKLVSGSQFRLAPSKLSPAHCMQCAAHDKQHRKDKETI
eukprot:gene25935-31320_t